mgnify:CR=1 FL=1
MSLRKEVESTLHEQESERSKDNNFVRLGNFMAEMKSKGLLLKRQYGLPPIDTIGKTVCQSKQD